MTEGLLRDWLIRSAPVGGPAILGLIICALVYRDHHSQLTVWAAALLIIGSAVYLTGTWRLAATGKLAAPKP